MSNPVAVLISDIHFTVPTLELASAALSQALLKADRLMVPLIVAGDLLDSKAIVRAECANRLIEIFRPHQGGVLVLPGNHDMIHEKSKEHSLNFLRGWVTVVDSPKKFKLSPAFHATLVPYQSNVDELQSILNGIEPGSNIICHQGVQTANMGHYMQDKTSLPKESYADFRVISGHYHLAQDIKCGRPRKGAVGLFSYIGNSYTLGFGEANDGPKGFRVLYEDGILGSVPTNLRKHIIVDMEMEGRTLRQKTPAHIHEAAGDLVLVRVKGLRSQLASLKKEDIMIGTKNFKLELIPIDDVLPLDQTGHRVSNAEMFDNIIDSISDTSEHKIYLKQLWRDLIDENS